VPAPSLLLPLLLAAAPQPIPLALGEQVLPVRLSLELRAGEPASRAGEAGAIWQDGPLPLAWWTGPDGEPRAEASLPAVDAVLRIEPAPGGARRLEVELRWRRAAGLEKAALKVAWPGGWPGAVGRDLAPRPLTAPVRTGRGTPLVAWAGPALLIGGPGLVAAALAPGQGGLEATLFLDDAAERPFATYLECLDALPRLDDQAGHGWADLERKRTWPRAPRRPGDVDHLAVTLYPRRPGSLGPLVPLRWARGAGAALVLTDHADRTSADALRAVLYGHSDARAEGSKGAGLLGRGLAITRSFFAYGGPGTLEDPEVAGLADALVAAGSEVAIHSVSEHRDGRETVRAGLWAAAEWEPRTWIDHQPYVNCEALSARGAAEAGAFGILGLLREAGLRWGWAAGDVGGFHQVELVDLFQAAPPSAPSPVLYPLPWDPGLWIFQSTFFYAPPRDLAAALSDEALQRLERGQGLFVGHTYLGAGPARTRGAGAVGRLAVRPAPGGGLVIDPDLDAALARVAGEVAAGRLASLTWDEAGERLVALGEVELRYREDGSVELINHGDRPLPGLALATPLSGLDWTVDGRPADGDPARRTIWLDLPPRAARRIEARRLGAAVPLLAPAGHPGAGLVRAAP